MAVRQRSANESVLRLLGRRERELAKAATLARRRLQLEALVSLLIGACFAIGGLMLAPSDVVLTDFQTSTQNSEGRAFSQPFGKELKSVTMEWHWGRASARLIGQMDPELLTADTYLLVYTEGKGADGSKFRVNLGGTIAQTVLGCYAGATDTDDPRPRQFDTANRIDVRSDSQSMKIAQVDVVAGTAAVCAMREGAYFRETPPLRSYATPEFAYMPFASPQAGGSSDQPAKNYSPDVRFCTNDDFAPGVYSPLIYDGSCQELRERSAFYGSSFSQLEQSNREHDSLLSGIFFGIAGAAALSAIPSLLGFLSERLRTPKLSRSSQESLELP